MRWRELVILLGAFLARTIRLQVRPLWYDEAFATLYGALSPARMVYGTVAPTQGAGAADVHPLLYYSFLHGWMRLVGQSPLAVRFLSVILGMITIAVLWRFASWCFDSQTGLVVGLLAAANPFHVAYSREARMYALLGLGAVTAAWGLVRALEGRRRQSHAESSSCVKETGGPRSLLSIDHWALFVLGSLLTLYAHNLGVFVLLSLHLLVLSRRQWRRSLASLTVADLVVLVLFGPWLVGVLPGQVSFVERGYWVSSPGLEHVIRAVMLPVLTFYEPAPLWLSGIGLFTSLLLLVFLVLRASCVCSRVHWFLLMCWGPILSLLIVSYWQPLYLERALLPSALFYLMAVGWLLAQGGLPRFVCEGLTVLLAVTTIGSLGVHYTYTRFPRPPFQEAVRYLQARVEGGHAVVHTNKLTYFPMYVYDPELPADFLADPPGSPQDTLAHPTQEALGIFATPTITEAVGQADTAWLVIFDQEIAQRQGGHLPLSWLEAHYDEIGHVSFSDLNIIQYERQEP